uniref:Odorant binding protein 10 n=1 Tax=Apolygus lucorum TaxID=248454 RepID=D4P933_APOLU|nr:odorant-binding protein 2 [Apolygus lucorum]AFJ54051.1 odorant binding protein 10 [Apolygus lucorum]
MTYHVFFRKFDLPRISRRVRQCYYHSVPRSLSGSSRRMLEETSQHHPKRRSRVSEKHKLPETDDGECMIACYMEEKNLMADGKINVKEANQTNSDKYDGEPDNKQLAEKLIDHCSSQVSPDGMSKCEYAYQFSKCGLEYGMKNGLTPPKMYEEQRR